MPSPGIVRNQTYLIIGGIPRNPGTYYLSKGETVGYKLTVRNEISPGIVRVRVIDIAHDRAILDEYVHFDVGETKTFNGSFKFTGDMIIEFQVWVSPSPGTWNLYDRYGC